MPDIHDEGPTMRPSIIAKLILLAVIVTSPVSGHVLIPISYEQRREEAKLIVIAEIIQSSSETDRSRESIDFKVLATLKGPRKVVLRVSRSTSIQEERLTCCSGSGRYILFLRSGRNGLYESVQGNYGLVRLAE